MAAPARDTATSNNPPPIDDPLFPASWHLENIGQTYTDDAGSIAGTPGFDMRVREAWAKGYTGDGVKVVVADDGMEGGHPDLAANFDAADSYDFGNDRPGGAHVDDDEGHGTSVGGVIGAVADNAIGSAGVAYDATLVSLRHGQNDAHDLDDDADDTEIVAAFDRATSIGADISNNSWGPDLPEPATPAIQAAIERFATEGRDGLGGVVTFAAGNERAQTLSASLEADQNSPYAIPVASVDQTGKFSVFSSPGANVLVSAPGENVETTVREGTAEGGGDYGLEDGTSFATPAVSGVAALILEANPDLTARDVQEILALSAYRSDEMTSYLSSVEAAEAARTTDEYDKWFLKAEDGELAKLVTPWDWQTNGASNWNGGGMHASHDYGFGMVDAAAATRLAETWTPSSSPEWQRIEGKGNGNAEGGMAVTVGDDADFTVAKATVSLDLPGPDVPDGASDDEQLDALLRYVETLDVRLVSPSGTTSYLVSGFDADQYEAIAARQQANGGAPDGGSDGADGKDAGGTGDDSGGDDDSDPPLLLTTAQVWGEDASGTWTIEAVDSKTGRPLGLGDWQLDLYGEADQRDDTYVFTDAFGKLTADDASREGLRDLDGGNNTINASMVTADLHLDMRVGSRSEVADGELRIGQATKITDAYGGAGNDRIAGTAAGNLIDGRAGDDVIRGFQADDVLCGGDGDDTLKGDAGHDRLYGQDGDDTLYGGDGDDLVSGGDGNDILVGGEGADIFEVYGDAPGDDVVRDFEAGVDRLKFYQASAKDGSALTSFDQIVKDIVIDDRGLTVALGGGSLVIEDVARLSATDVMIA
ncbi:S8 family serine peptidase [Marinivivus vitaminiproducens]|uniref:S8 family serine peptidase n=1 Tax=Marinivivus vitaminiproducens TaxID=3035935 RepID=UPI00279E0264|nr:S8 family serine peptidase [Geminicoccaceae bacterium SCSIO 64248]